MTRNGGTSIVHGDVVVSGRYAHQVPVFTAFVKWRPSSSSAVPSRRIAPLMRWVGDRPPGSLGGTPGRPGSAREPERLRELLDDRVELEFGALGPRPVAVVAGLVDLTLQLPYPRLVAAAGLVVQERPGAAADIRAAHEFECVHLAAGCRQKHGEVEHPLGVADRRAPFTERHEPDVTGESHLMGASALGLRLAAADLTDGVTQPPGQSFVALAPRGSTQSRCASVLPPDVCATSTRPSEAASVAKWWSMAPP